jgi:hypothetical protein
MAKTKNSVITHIGNFKTTEKFLNFIEGRHYLNVLAKYGEQGVSALAAATPKDTGKTASSWMYEIEYNNDSTTIRWFNTNVVNHVNIAIILQQGHGTRNGGYVQGIDYINPALKPIFDAMADRAWKEVQDA